MQMTVSDCQTWRHVGFSCFSIQPFQLNAGHDCPCVKVVQYHMLVLVSCIDLEAYVHHCQTLGAKIDALDAAGGTAR